MWGDVFVKNLHAILGVTTMGIITGLGFNAIAYFSTYDFETCPELPKVEINPVKQVPRHG